MEASGNLKTKVLIIGAGPSGLSAAFSLKNLGHDFLIIEFGKSLNFRERYDSVDSAHG